MLLIPSFLNPASAIGPYPCYFYLHLEKTIYNPGDSANIRAEHCNPQGNSDNVTLIIADARNVTAESFLTGEYIMNSSNVIHTETKQAVNGIANFTYKIPMNVESYRYLVAINPGEMGGYDYGFFFTKPDADKIIVSDLRIYNPTVKQGENLNFELKVTDGLGTPIPLLIIYPSADYGGCGGQGGIEQPVDISQKSLEERQLYASSGKMYGWLPIPLGTAGEYELKIKATVENYPINNEWITTVAKGSKFRVSDESAIKDELVLFTESETPFDPLQPVQSKVISQDAPLHTFDWAIQSSPPNISSQLSHSTCNLGNSVMPVQAELAKLKINPDDYPKTFVFDDEKTASRDESCFNDLNSCIVDDEITTKVSNESSTSFSGLGEDFMRLTQESPGEYLIRMTANHEGKEYSNFAIARIHNYKTFLISAENRDFPVKVDGWYSNPGELQFEQDAKKIMFNVNSTDPLRRTDISIPHELLDGGYSVLVNGVKQDLEKTGNIKKIESYTLFSVSLVEGPNSIEIIGTTVVPEFSYPILISLVTAIGIVVYVTISRIKIAIDK